MIELKNLTVTLGDEVVLDDVSLSLSPGRLLALIGPSGAGKSVLLKALCGLVPIRSGEIRIRGQAVEGRREAELFELRQGIGMLFQGGALFDTLSVFENVAFPLRRRGIPEDELRARVDAELDRVRLSHATGLLPGQLSGGMKKRVGLARALIARPHLALFDEPTAGLDPVTAAKILAIIQERVREAPDVAGIAVGHELDTLLPACDEVAMLEDGKLVFHGPVATLAAAETPNVRRFVAGALEEAA